MCVLCRADSDNPDEALVYDDGRIRVALSLHQKASNLGSLLVFPVAHFENLFDLPEELTSEVLRVAQRMAHRLKAVLGCEGVTLLQNNDRAGGQDVFHFHLHVIPRFTDDGYFGAPSAVTPREVRRALADRLRG